MTKFAFVFPGQGSQSRGMMNGYADFAAVRDTFTEASDVLKQDLWQLVAEGSDADLNLTVNTQPIMLTAGVAVYRAWQSQNGAKPTMMAGHSLGEYTALVAAGALRFADALPLVRYRAQCMQQAVPEGVGGIAAILGLDDDVVRAVCSESAQGEVLEAVNYNSPGQVVIAGNRAAVERGMELAKARGAKRAIPLPVAGAYHSPLMTDAQPKLQAELAKVKLSPPVVPVISNVTGQPHGNAAEISARLVEQVTSSVLWEKSMRHLLAQGFTRFIELGPGTALSGFMKRIDKTAQMLNVADVASLEATAKILNG